MKNEREMFEAWCHIDDQFCTHRYTDNCQEYSDDYTQSAWLAWQASAQRQTYNLVPVEPTIAMVRAYYETPKPTASRCYQAMIGAV